MPTEARVEAIVIRGSGAASALGFDTAGGRFGAGAAEPASPFQARSFSPPGVAVPVAAVRADVEASLTALRSESALRPLDRAALLAVLAARQAVAAAGWTGDDTALAVGIGSSRGATGRLEDAFEAFQADGRTAPSTSPITTPGNLAAAVAHDLLARGADAHLSAAVSHSSTCSSALQALGTGLAWLKAGLADRYLAGGTEAPLTPFTVAQLRAVGIYSSLPADAWPCRPGQAGATANTFVLGEGAAVFALERAVPQPGDVVLASVGFGFERAASRTGITPTGEHFQQAMRQALRLAGRAPHEIDAIILHAPGTVAGDAAELAAIRAVCGQSLPTLFSNKWLIGHTLGAAGALSVQLAIELLRQPIGQRLATPPFTGFLTAGAAGPFRRVLVNAAGFGGNAACALVEVV